MTSPSQLLDDVFDDGAGLPGIALLAIVQKDEGLAALKELVREFPQIKVDICSHGRVRGEAIAGSAVILIECRILEAFADLQHIRQVRQIRPLVPIIVISLNDDLHFQKAAFEAGCTEYLVLNSQETLIGYKVISLNNFSQATRILEIKNSEVVSTIKSLRESNEKLEREMASRVDAESKKALAEEKYRQSQQIKEIMDSLEDGFFWVGSDLRINATISRNCQTIFGKDIATHRIGDHALALIEESETYLGSCLVQVFDDFMPQSVSINLLPKKATTRSGKTVALSYTVIMNEKSAPEKVIIVARDITKEEADKARYERAKQDSQNLINILRHKQAFTSFLIDCRHIMTQIRGEKDEKTIARLLHTLKGNSAAFGLNEVARRVHEVESKVAKLSLQEVLGKIHRYTEDIEEAMQEFLKSNYEVLRLSYTNAIEHFTIDSNFIDHLRTIAQAAAPEIKDQLLDLVQLVHLKPISVYTTIFTATVNNLAEKFGKKISFSMSGLDPSIDVGRFEALFKNLIHTIRNSCDHGLETPDERLGKGKSPEGHLALSFATDKNGDAVIVIKDDGRGIDRDAITKKALEIGIVTQASLAVMSEKEVFELIFHDHVSTSQNLTDISGRGIGMAALWAQVNELGGMITIASQKDKGTELSISIPNLYKRQKTVEIAHVKVLKIMICDDEEALCEIYKSVLEREGYEIHTFNNGLDATLQLAREQFDLIITDLNMPGLRGETLLSKLREKMDESSVTPIIVISGFASSHVRAQLKAHQFVEVVDKPTDLKALVKLVESMLHAKQA